MSGVETCLNTLIGFAIAIATQVLVFPLFGFAPPLSTNFKIGLIFTVVSILRGYMLRRLFEFFHIRRPLSAFMQAVIAECYRQREIEGWTVEHDDEHEIGDLAAAGAAYALTSRARRRGQAGPSYDGAVLDWEMTCWPWSRDWWKPRDNRRDLVRGAALIIAEGEKFDRSRTRVR
jgi:hypothetical protein